MEYFKKLVGDRIYLSPMGESEEEVKKFTEWMNNFSVTDYIGESAHIVTLSRERDWLGCVVCRNEKQRCFNIVDLSNDNLIGTVSLSEIDWVCRTAVLGIFIGDENYRSEGYGTETIKILLEYAFKYLNLHSVKLELLSANERAHKCYLKCGFKDVGRKREAIFLNGKYYDKLQMDILENEFEGEYIRNKEIK